MSESSGLSRAPLRVVVLTCAGLGYETAATLEEVPGVEVVGVFDSPHRRLPLRRRLRKVWRTRGAAGLLALAARRLLRLSRELTGHPSAHAHAAPMPRCPIFAVADLHSNETLDELRALQPDLGIVDGTYILKPVLFDLPRLGCVNLHCGRVPEYRGAPPAFWELYDGVDEVGITVHQITEKLDEGPVYMECTLPLDITPHGDPMQFVAEYWRTTLRPQGIALLKDVVAAFRDGRAHPVPQRVAEAQTHRFPTRHDVRELERRVAARVESSRRSGHLR